jgi:hypothetical protein
MYGELASVKGTVDLSPQDALDRAEGFLAAQGYVIGQRTYTTVNAQRRAESEGGEQNLLTLTVAVAPLPEGGVRITVRGNDQDGVQQRQAAWMEWSESLPKKPEPETAEGAEQDLGGTSAGPLPPPPHVGSADLPPSPQAPPTRGYVPPVTTTSQRRRSLGFWASLGAGGCLILVVLLVGAVGLLAALGGGSGQVAEKPKQERQVAQQEQPQKKEPQPQKEEQQAQGGQK